MERIQEVQQEVESLAARVEQFNGNSRTDKEYLFLDEMLTRELIKLDTIEVEGNDSLRTARKDVIRNIQKTIALLENKADSGKPTTETNSTEVSSNDSMEVDNTKTTSNAESSAGKASG
jgi:BCL2-associated athanogene 3